jgi:subtilisin family serine protease
MRQIFGFWGRKCRLAIAALFALAVVARAENPPARFDNPSANKFVAGQVLVQFKANANDAEIAEALKQNGLRLHKRIHTKPMQAKGHRGLDLLASDLPVEQAVQKLQQHPTVEFAEPNWVFTHQEIANDPYFTAGYMWGLYGDSTVPANLYGSQASKAWAAGYTGTNTVYVGIIDEGVQWQHPDLAGNVWNNPFDPVDGIDNDRNDFVDDVHGWDFYSWNNTVYDSAGDDHGTHVAGTIGATGANGLGVAGVNWNVRMIPAKFLSSDGGTVADAIEAIDYMVDLKARHGLNIVALNNSWAGGGYSQALHDAIIRTAKAGILFVAAAGNGDSEGRGLNNDKVPSYPSNYNTTKGTSTATAASYNAVIAVAAIDNSGNLATFSNFGALTVHIGAPGVNVLSTVPTGGYAYYSGTSMAAPHVTGAVALYASTHPAAKAVDIRNALLNSATPTPSLVTKTTTGARLNLSTVILPPINPATLPAKLKQPRRDTNGLQFTLEGVVNQVYDIQVSIDFKAWSTLMTVTNTTGAMTITDPQSPSATSRFYRAVTR